MTDEKKVPASVDKKIESLKKEISNDTSKTETKPKPKPAAKPAPKPTPKQEKLELTESWQKDLVSSLNDSVVESFVASNELNIVLKNDDKFLDNFKNLKEKDFDYLSDISSVDYSKFGEDCKRFGLSYHLYSLKNNVRLRIKILLDESENVPSVMEIWKTADFHEREAFDLMGLGFTGRTGLKRILLPSDWVGHPLRKDYKKDEGRDEYTAKMIRKFKEDE